MKSITVPWFNLEITNMRRVLAVHLLAFLLVFTTACPISQSDLQKAEQIASDVIQALPLVLQLVGQFQATVPATVMADVQKYATEAKNDIALAQQLLQQYGAAVDAAVKQDLITKINAALATAQTNLTTILNAFHIFNAALVAKVSAAVATVIAAVSSLQALVPALLGKLKAQAVQVKLMSAKGFKAQFNSVMQMSTGDAAVDNAARSLVLK